MRGSDSPSHLNELAFHFREAAPVSGAAKAVEYLRRAAEHSATQFAWTDAIRDFEAALELHTQTSGGQQGTRIELAIGLGLAQGDSGDELEAVETLREATDVAAALAHPELTARATDAYAKWAAWSSSGADAPATVPRVQRALELLADSDQVLRARLLSRLAGASTYVPEDSPLFDQGVALSDEALSILQEAGAVSALSEALLYAFHLAWRPHLFERRIELSAELRAVATAADDLLLVIEAHQTGVYCLLEQGHFTEAAQAVNEMDALAERSGSRRAKAIPDVLRAWIALLRGEFAAAEEHARSAMRTGRGVSSTGFHEFIPTVVLAFVGRAQGRLPALQDDIIDTLRAEDAVFGASRVALALVLDGLGEQAEAHALYEALAVTGFEGVERDLDRLPAYAGLAELCVSIGDTDRAPTLYALLEPYADRIAAVHSGIYGSVARHLGLLASLSGSVDTAVGHFEHALERNEQSGARPWLAWTQLDYATLLTKRGEGGDLRRARARLGGRHHGEGAGHATPSLTLRGASASTRCCSCRLPRWADSA